MIVEDKADAKIHELVSKAVQEQGHEKAELIPVLHIVNRELGHISPETILEISRQMKIPASHINSVATFYRMLSTKARGKHTIQFCESAPCHVAGGRAVWRALQEQLQLESGETSADGKWTLLTTSCLGVCGVGPVMVIDGDIYGNVTAPQVKEILSRY